MPGLDSELKDKKVLTPKQELFLLALEAWRKNTETSAVAELVARVQDKPRLIRELVQHYFETRIVRDMSGAVLKESVQGGQMRTAYGQLPGATLHGPVEDASAKVVLPSGQESCAEASSPVESGEAIGYAPVGQCVPASPLSPVEDDGAMFGLPSGHSMNAPSSSPSEDASAKPELPSGQMPGAEASSSVREEAGQLPPAQSQPAGARFFPKPNLPRGLSAMARASEAQSRSLFDTFKVRGIPIGDLTVGEARRLAARNRQDAGVLLRESRVAEELCNHVGGFVSAGVLLRDAVKPEVLERAVAKNMELSDVV